MPAAAELPKTETLSAQAKEVPPSEAVIATRRMYAAHQSLRSEEVDNPDSASNQRIKQEMLLKVFARAESSEVALASEE